MTACYNFADASSRDFGSTEEYPDGLHRRFGLWGRNAEDKSSNYRYRELCNLVEMQEEEAANGHLRDVKLWIFNNNSTAESFFFKGGSNSFLLHDLILRL
jgi:hypothetical protein